MNNPDKILIFSDCAESRTTLLHEIQSSILAQNVFAFPLHWNPYKVVEQHQPLIIILHLKDQPSEAISETISKIVQNFKTRILVLGESLRSSDAANLILAGADGFVLQHKYNGSLEEKIQILRSGGMAISPELIQEIFHFLRNPIVFEKSKKLTKKELQLLKEARNGSSNKELAEHFNIGVSTVRTHCKSIYRKLGVNGRIEAINTVFLTPGVR